MTTHAFPANAIAAATHRDPYPYYAHLVARTPMYRDDALGLWVATSAEAVTAVLTSDICRVRPVAEPIPTALLGSPAAAIFSRLIRMNDGGGHCPFNRAVAATLGTLDPSEIAKRSAHWARALAEELNAVDNRAGLTEYMFQLSVQVLGSSLGLPGDKLRDTGQWISRFVRSVFPGSTHAQVEEGKTAAGQLLELFRAVLASSRSQSNHSLLARLALEGERAGRADVDVILANGIGFLSQAYEATAGLIGNTLLTLARHPRVRGQVAADDNLVSALVREVLRYDPPAHNTRRFPAADGTVAGQPMKAGDSILVVVAAANRDPAANPQPDQFDLFRADTRLYTFGVGVHACPGDRYATTIAEAAVTHLLRTGLHIEKLPAHFTYRLSANTRIPLFA